MKVPTRLMGNRTHAAVCFVWLLSSCQSATAIGTVQDPVKQVNPCSMDDDDTEISKPTPPPRFSQCDCTIQSGGGTASPGYYFVNDSLKCSIVDGQVTTIYYDYDNSDGGTIYCQGTRLITFTNGACDAHDED